MLPFDSRPGAVEAQVPSALMVPEHSSDMVIAHAIVHAIRAVPGVSAMGQGLFAKAATYGPGKHVSGIVLQHPTPDSLSVEVHVVLEEAAFTKAYTEISDPQAPSSSNSTPMLLRFTDQIRAVIAQTLKDLGFPVSTIVDVTIDDIR